MMLTESRPEAAAEPAPEAAQPAPAELWLTTADHKRLGLLYIAFSTLYLLLGVVLGELMRAEQSAKGVQILGSNFFRTFSMHATVTGVLFLAPLWTGIATYVVPLQIGTARLALPRLHSFALWLYVVGGGVVVTGYLIGPPNGLGLSVSTPLAAPTGGANRATTLWITGLVLVTLGTLLASVDLAVTVLQHRTEGLTVARLPMFSLATLATSLLSILATPVFLAGLALLFVDEHTGGPLFAASSAGGQDVWQHMLWLFGRPDVYLLTVPGLGAACDIVATHARRPLLNAVGARSAVLLFGFLSLAAWAAGSQVRHAVVLPTYSVPTALVAVPVAVLALTWLGTVATGRLRFHISLVFVLGFLGLLLLGAINAAVAAAGHVEGGAAGSSWSTAQLHVVAFAAPTLLAVGALYHWSPKLFGRQLSAAAGALVFLALFGGFLINGLGTYLLGYKHAPWHLKEYAAATQFDYSRVASAGGVLVLLGVLLLVGDILRVSLAEPAEATPADPYEGLTLEWATASPPAPGNFDAVPEVRSAHPLLDLRTAPPAASGDEEATS